MADTKHQIQEQLEHRILHGLACEWETAIWVLEPQYHRSMKKPMFCLKDLKKTWGYWSGEREEICLSRSLVLNYAWDTVREVLLHEMAHQLAEQVLHATDKPPHGKNFLKACHLLRANPRASGRYKPLRERLDDENIDSNDRLLIRIKKLLALAQSRNKHEAEAAMVKAHELIKKYNIDILQLEENRNFHSLFIGKPALRNPREVYHLARLLQDFYFVQGIWVSAYVMDKGKMGRVLEISGTRPNLAMASYVHDFVNRYVENQWNRYNRKKKLNRYRKTDFAVGIIEGFREKLLSQGPVEKTPAETHAVVTVEDPQLESYMTYKYPRTVSFKRNVSNQDESVVRDGKQVGKKLVIHKGISEKSKAAPRLIENQKS